LVNALLIILFLSETAGGRLHDKRLAEGTPYPLPAGSRLLQDLGFLAFTLPQVEILMPTKKPRGQELTLEQQLTNQALHHVWSKNSKPTRWQSLRPCHGLHFGLPPVHLIMHTRRQWRAEQTEGDRRMDWKTLLAYITGTVDQELLLRNEYLVTENCILRNQLKGRIRLSDGERKTLAVIGRVI
jgi:hypothetical protein